MFSAEIPGLIARRVGSSIELMRLSLGLPKLTEWLYNERGLIIKVEAVPLIGAGKDERPVAVRFNEQGWSIVSRGMKTWYPDVNSVREGLKRLKLFQWEPERCGSVPPEAVSVERDGIVFTFNQSKQIKCKLDAGWTGYNPNFMWKEKFYQTCKEAVEALELLKQKAPEPPPHPDVIASINVLYAQRRKAEEQRDEALKELDQTLRLSTSDLLVIGRNKNYNTHCLKPHPLTQECFKAGCQPVPGVKLPQDLQR